MSDQELTLDELKTKNEELMNNWKRAVADFENYKKRKIQENRELVDMAREMTLLKLLPSLQSLEQVLKFAPAHEQFQDWILGLKATILQLEKAMEEMGLKKLKTVGEKFDPSVHEALEEESGEEGKVLKEIQPGFMLNDKVIIPAKVVVGKSQLTPQGEKG